MKSIGWIMVKIKCKLKHSQEPLLNYWRKGGAKIGNKVLLCSDLSSEPYLIEIGDKTTISVNVSFVTHDYSAHNVLPGKSDIFGRIKIGRNCFVGMNSTLLLGVTLADNIVVAAGSVVTKSFLQSNIIIGGNPAKVIGTWDEYEKKYIDKATPNGMNKKDVKQNLLNNQYLVEK